MNETQTISSTQRDDIVVLHIKGKLDSTLSPTLEKKAFELLDSGQTKIIINFDDVSYVNSAGLRMLLSIKKQVKSNFGKLICCCLRNEVLEVMKICGFDHVLEICLNEEEAIRRF